MLWKSLDTYTPNITVVMVELMLSKMYVKSLNERKEQRF